MAGRRQTDLVAIADSICCDSRLSVYCRARHSLDLFHGSRFAGFGLVRGLETKVWGAEVNGMLII